MTDQPTPTPDEPTAALAPDEPTAALAPEEPTAALAPEPAAQPASAAPPASAVPPAPAAPLASAAPPAPGEPAPGPAGEEPAAAAPPPGTGRTGAAPADEATADLDGPTRRLTVPDGADSPDPVTAATAAKPAPWRSLSSAGALIWVLLALFGFTLVVQLRSNDGDQGLATARQEDLVRILSDLEARDSRLQSEINALETSQRQLTSGVAGRQAALAEAEKRADELGLLAGTLPGRGPGLRITLDRVKASAILNAVQELRGAGGEVMQLGGPDGTAVRIVASSYFVDVAGGGILVDGVRLTGPYTLLVIGQPQTMQTALQIPGGVVASVNSAGGSVTLEQRATVEVTAVRKATTLQYARPAS